MNQLCRVCGEPAAGFHFGAFTCEGCKSFFGRSYNNLSSISECKNNGECVINKKNRTACKACRLRKCLLVGMSKSGSRYGRRSNWFKIHCLLQQQQQQQQQHHQQVVAGVGATPAPSLLPPHPFYLHPRLAVPSSLPPASDTKSSASDSGASSADPDDEARSGSAFSLFNPAASPGSDRSNASSRLFGGAAHAHAHAPTSAPAASPGGGGGALFQRWLPPLLATPDLWLRRPIPVAVPAPEQNEPIDLSVKTVASPTPATHNHAVLEEEEEGVDDEDSVDVGMEEAPKSAPMNLSKDAVDGVQ